MTTDQSQNQISMNEPVLEGAAIKKIFQNAEVVAELHSVLTSSRGQYFRLKILQYLRNGLTLEEVERLRKEFGVEESERHLNKFLKFNLIQETKLAGELRGYIRTLAGEEALNIARELERKIGEDRAKRVFEAALGPNSVKLFLTIFGNAKEPDFTSREIIYTPLEIGQLARLFTRSVEGISSIDKLDDAGLVSYLEDGNIHVNPRRSTAFYYYLKNLYQLLVQNGIIKK